MPVLWCGGEDIDFPNGGTPVMSLGSNSYCRFTAGFARYALNATSVSAPILSPTFPSPACGSGLTGWLSQRVAIIVNESSSYAAGFCKDATSGAGLYIGWTSTVSKLGLFKFDGASTWTLLQSESGATFVVTSAGNPHKVDMQVINYGANATVNVYLDGTLNLTFTGDVTVSGVTSLSAVGISGSGGAGYHQTSELIVADEDTRLFSLATMAPNAVGDANAWTGAYTDVNETAINDTTELYTNTAGLDAQFNLLDIPVGTFNVKAVKLVARCTKSGSAAVGSICLGVKTGGTVNPGSAQAQVPAWAITERLMTQNPVTVAPWLQSEMNPLQVNLRSAT